MHKTSDIPVSQQRMAPWLAALLLQATPLARAAETAPDLSSLGPMIVTATRRPEPLLDYPGSLSRLTADDLQATGAMHQSEALNRVPGVFIQRGSGEESLTAIRSPVLTGAGSCGAFLFLEDSIPIRPAGFCNVNDLFEVNSEQAAAIEILRGPGSALYGSNAVHGIVNVLSPDPAALPAFGASIETGADQFLRPSVVLSEQGENTDVGLYGHWTHDGGFRVHSGFEEAKINAALLHRAERGVLRIRLAATDLDQQTAGFIEGFEAYRDPRLRSSNANPEAFRAARSARLSAHWQDPISENTEFNLRAIARNSRMDFLQHFLLGKPLERNGQDSIAMLLSVDHSWRPDTTLTFGIDSEFSNSSLTEIQAGPTLEGAPAARAIRPAGLHYDYRVAGASVAAYGQLEQALTEHWRISAGLRAEYIHHDYDNRMLDGNTDQNGVPCAFGGCLFNRPADRSDGFTNLAPKLGLSWGFASHQRLYLNVARGYRAPEATELYRLQRQQTVASLNSERIASYELGLRQLGGKFSYSLAAFWLDKHNVIFRDANAFNVSDGKTRHQGLEYELNWSLLPTVRLSAAGTVARHRYEFSRSVEQGEQIRSGNDVDTAPRNLHSIRLNWSPSAALGAELEWLRVGEYFVDAANEHRYGGHQLFNLRTHWQLSDRWQVAARVNNLFDQAYADRADFAFGAYRYFPGRERSAFFEIGYASN